MVSVSVTPLIVNATGVVSVMLIILITFQMFGAAFYSLPQSVLNRNFISGHLVQLVQEQALPKMPGKRTRPMDGCEGG